MKQIQIIKVIWTLLFVLILSNSSIAQTPEVLFQQGNEFYKQEAYNKALETYKRIEKQKQESDALYFNIGNCYYKLNKIAPSIYYYEKALALNPNNDQVKENLVFAKRLAIDHIEPLPKTFLQSAFQTVILDHNSEFWAYVSIVSCVLGAILFLCYFFFDESLTKRVFFTISSILMLNFLVTMTFAYQNKSYFKTHVYAIIFNEQSDIKNGPSLTAETIFELHEGTKVQILKTEDDWDEIKLEDGKTGWMLSDDLRKL